MTVVTDAPASYLDAIDIFNINFNLKYVVDHRTRTVLVINLKVGSRTLERAIQLYTKDLLFRKPKESMHEYLSYFWVMVTREPLDKLGSYFDADFPPKQHKTYEELVDAILSGWENPHTTPQSWLITDLKTPDLLLDISELTPRWGEVAARFSWPLPMQIRNESPTRRPIPDYRKAELVNYYREDYERFGYEIPA